VRILALETSCDETALAVVEEGRRVLFSRVASQTEVHRLFSGVFPEKASRLHLETVWLLWRETREALGGGIPDAVAVTAGPGLPGSLLVGLMAAKTLAFLGEKPLIPVNHLVAHLYAVYLAGVDLLFPALGLVVSGGHTDLFLLSSHREIRRLGGTRDDAAGEAFDKVGRLLGLPYPGGPEIDRLSREGDPRAIPFPRAYLEGTRDFSFSGLKTAVAVYLEKSGDHFRPADVAASFQEAVVDVLVEKTVRTAEELGVGEIVMAGGVAANRRLRERMGEECAARGFRLHVPPPSLCTDNAAMVGARGYFAFREGVQAGLDLEAFPRGTPLF